MVDLYDFHVVGHITQYVRVCMFVGLLMHLCSLFGCLTSTIELRNKFSNSDTCRQLSKRDKYVHERNRKRRDANKERRQDSKQVFVEASTCKLSFHKAEKTQKTQMTGQTKERANLWL